MALHIRIHHRDETDMESHKPHQSEGDNEQRAVYARGAKGEDEMLIRF